MSSLCGQELQQRLSKENRTMKEMVEGATAKNATIIAKYEQDIESQRAQLIKVQLLEEQVTQLTEKLKVEARAKSQAVDNWFVAASLRSEIVTIYLCAR